MLFKHKIQIVLAIDIILIIFMSINEYLVIEKPFISDNTKFVSMRITENSNGFRKGDIIIKVDNEEVSNHDEVEYLCDLHRVGDEIPIEIKRDGEQEKINITLVNYYEFSHKFFELLTALLFLFVGIFVLIKKPNTKFSYLLNFLTFSAAMMILNDWGMFFYDYLWITFINRSLYDFSLIFTPLFFLHFSLLFPEEKLPSLQNKLNYFYSFAFAAWFIALFLEYRVVFIRTINDFRDYYLYHNYFLDNIFIPLFIIVLISFIHSYFTAKGSIQRKKLLWILIGIIAGPFLFTFLYLLPKLFGLSPLISENTMVLSLSIAPITFGIAIFRYKLFDINLIVSRGIIYSSLIVIFSISYILLLYILTFITAGWFASLGIQLHIILAITMTFLFQPFKNKFQKYMNSKLFSLRFNTKKVLNNFLNKIRETTSDIDIGILFEESLRDILPIEEFALISHNSETQIIYSKNFEFENKEIKYFENLIENNKNVEIFAIEDILEEEISYKSIPTWLFKKVALILTSSTENSSSNLSVVLSKKLNEHKFTIDEIDFLKTILKASAITHQKIKLQIELINEITEKKKLIELNEMKSYFVSSVSHELKTPLTAIKLYAEFLNSNPNLSAQKKTEYLKIIEGESERLDRLINNVLGFSKIEKGTKTYKFDFVCVKKIIEYVLETFHYQLNMQNFETNFSYETGKSYTIEADEDSLKEVFINIISNAIKYSVDKKILNINLATNENYVVIEIEDKGLGISRTDLENIFVPFYRSNENNIASLGGAGLGLAIVKSILDAHNAVIQVESEVGFGTKFKIFFKKILL